MHHRLLDDFLHVSELAFETLAAAMALNASKADPFAAYSQILYLEKEAKIVTESVFSKILEKV